MEDAPALELGVRAFTRAAKPGIAPWHDVRDNHTTGRTAPLVLIASDDKPAGDQYRPAADAEGRPA